MRIADRVSALALLSGLALGSVALPTAALACDAAAAGGTGQSSNALSRTGDPTVGVDSNAPDEARALFRQADSDANGTISPEEWRNWRERISVQATAGAGS